MNIITKMLAAWMTIMASAIAIAAPQITEEKAQEVKPDRGYWFYEYPEKKKKEKKKKVKQTQISKREPLGPLPPYRDLMNAHPEDLRKIFKERLDEVVWQPTPQNMYAFMIVKDVARRKALAATQMHAYMLLRSPELNMNTARAVSTFARDTEVKAKMAAINNALKREKRRYALIYFRSDTCIYCREQDQVMRYFKMRTGWNVKIVDFDRNPILAERLNVSMTPTVLLIKKNSDDYMPVAVGATAADEMIGNIYRATRMLNGEITEQQFYMYEFDKGGMMDPFGDPTQLRTSMKENQQ